MTDDQNDPTGDFERHRKEMEKYEELFRSKVDDLEAAGRKVGLYVRDIGLSVAPMVGHAMDGSHEMSVEPVMIANFTVGDQAWSDRVQNAEQYTTEAEFRKMSVEMDRDKFEETRAELERRLREGKDLLGDDETSD